MNKNENLPEFNRRDFLRNTSLASLMALMGGVELRAADAPAPAASAVPALTAIPVGPPVKYGVIGLGVWGREIITTLSLLPNAPIVAVCDHYPSSLRRGSEAAPQAEKYDDYTQLLANKDVQAVVIATPTHQHVEIVLAALAAGKHVYCEAPLANSIEDAKAIAKAAKASVKSVFQVGLQERSHPQRRFLLPFLRAGAIGKNVMIRSQSHKKQSWSRVSSNPDHEKELNWRLHRDTSTGLIGEMGIHHLDAVTWFLRTRPTAVNGFGSIIFWNDGRDVPDTVQAVFEYPEGVNYVYDATICNSFDSEYEMYYGSDAAVMVRDAKAWMFKEVDSPLLGWEVYARKDVFYEETGVALMADATKQTSIGKGASAGGPSTSTPLFYALEAFTKNVGVIGAAVEDFVANFGDSDLKALQDQLATLKKEPAAGWQEGLGATVLAIKANEATLNKQKITLQNEWFEI